MTRIQLRRDTSSNWQTNNPTPSLGEPCYETDTKKLKIGDGVTKYNDLQYFSGEAEPYTLPQANATTLGGVKANEKSDEDTQPVNIDPATGLLYTKAGGGTSDAYTKAETDNLLDTKQDKLTIGAGLSLVNNEISIDTQSYKGIVYNNNDTSFGELNYSTGVYNQKTAIQYPTTKDGLAVVAFDGNIDNITSFEYKTVVKVTDVSNRNGVVMFAGNAASNYVSIDCWNGYSLRAVCSLDGSSTITEEGIINAQNNFAALRIQHTGTTLNVFTYVSPNGELPSSEEDWVLKFTREWDLSQNPISGNNLYLFVLGGSLFFDQTLKTTNTIGGTYYLNQTVLTINNTNVFNKLSDSNAVIASEDKLGLVKIDNDTIILNNNSQLQANLPTNIVTTDTTQTITGQKEFTNTILSLDRDLIRGQESETYRYGAGLTMGDMSSSTDGGSFAPQWKIYNSTGGINRLETIITSYNQSTLNATNFNTANKLVRLDSTGKLPAIDGSQLTGISAGSNSLNAIVMEQNNFNNYIKAGVYYWDGHTTPVNHPNGNYQGMLQVLVKEDGNSPVVQIFTLGESLNTSTSPEMWIRYCNSGRGTGYQWSSWLKVNGGETPANMVTTENFLSVAPTGNLKYWTGTENDYTGLTTKDADTLYRTTDTNKVYLGTIQIGGNA